MAAQKRAELGDVLMANEEHDCRGMKRRLGIAEEALRIKKERLEDAVQEYDEEHKTFTIFSKRLEEKWEQRFDAVAALARASGVRSEDIEAARKQEWRAANAASNVAVPAEEIAAPEPSARSQRGAWLAQVRAEAEAKAAAAEAEAEAARISKQQQQQPKKLQYHTATAYRNFGYLLEESKQLKQAEARAMVAAGREQRLARRQRVD